MATLTRTYTFTSGTTAVAAEVNTNFDDVVSFVNAEAIQKDGSKAMTAALTLVDAEPSGSNVALRRKSGYRSNLAAEPAGTNFTVGGGVSATFAYLNSPVTDPFGYTPDYNYRLILHVTGTIFLSGSGQSAFVRLESPTGTPCNVFGPGTSQEAQFTAGTNNVYQAMNFIGTANHNAGVVPAYSVMYKISGLTTCSIWGTVLAYIVPQTRQLPN